MEQVKILVVDDNREIANAIDKLLTMEGYEVVKAYNGLDALDALVNNNIKLILLDIMMPKLDGLSTTLKIREKKNIPIILLSAKSEDSDKILGLSMGADDYITKPFNPQELIARVKSQLRRYMYLGDMENITRSSQITVAGLSLDKDSKQLFIDRESVRLTPTEYKIMDLLMTNAGIVFSAEKIYEIVWEEPAYSVENTVMVHIRRIREKIEINPKEPKYLKVVWGIGYKIEKYQ
ncbi:DNA-binding response regulator [Tissierella sp. P1]|uniref:response regulator transcription factor n=1 Tax=Tissierella sp. P1 TaxID=1280483 RepID=UPI000BA0E1AF|nr:response regulator transcription factor [Tissierella sp. P1]OZV10627.1 DNA-binding response regulator [Tissierella sp. P1]